MIGLTMPNQSINLIIDVYVYTMDTLPLSIQKQ